MSGELDLLTLLRSMSPVLLDGDYVFLTFPNARYGDHADLSPIASMMESEGLTLIVEQQTARAANLPCESIFKCITLQVHSSLQAVGLTAAISDKLSVHSISANIVAGFYHDHIFVPEDLAGQALQVLKELSS